MIEFEVRDASVRERVLIQDAFWRGVRELALRLGELTASAATIRGDWLDFQLGSPPVRLPDGLADELVKRRDAEEWHNAPCADCGCKRGFHQDFSGPTPTPGPCGFCGCDGFKEAS